MATSPLYVGYQSQIANSSLSPPLPIPQQNYFVRLPNQLAHVYIELRKIQDRNMRIKVKHEYEPVKC